MSTITRSSTAIARDEKGQVIRLRYAAPMLTVYGRMDRLTMATSLSGTNTDAQYPRCETENGAKLNCYS